MVSHNKDIKGKIIKLLRENNGIVETSTKDLAYKFGCTRRSVNHSIRQLIDTKVILDLEDTFKRGGHIGSHSSHALGLDDTYKRGNKWRNVGRINGSNVKHVKDMVTRDGKKSAQISPESSSSNQLRGVGEITLDDIARFLQQSVNAHEKNKYLEPLRGRVTQLEDELKATNIQLKDCQEELLTVSRLLAEAREAKQKTTFDANGFQY
jgi:polyhydroxyalkanoate synthesis regulator phasin